jgi:rod shape determining protein RodA
MTPLLRKFLGMNWLIFAIMIALAAFGVFAIYSATWMRDEVLVQNFWRRQAMWVGIGMAAFFVASLVDYRWVKWGALPMYLAGIGFLILARLIGTRVNGAKSWINIGPINFQPAQLAVIAGIMVMAILLSQFRNLHPALRLLLCGIICGAPMLLILLQPDLGEVIIWVPVILAMLFVGGMPKRYLICIVLLGTAFIPLMVNFGLHGFQRDRITAFLDPDLDPLNTGYGINQALNAVGSGGWAGLGFKSQNSQIEIEALPQTAVQNDYIFPVIANQWGFLGGVILISAFGLLLITCLIVAYRAADDVGVLLCVGFSALIFTHVFQNIGMMVGMLPITGVPLPLISYSGSFVLMVMFALGLVNSVWVHRKAVNV